MARPGPARTMRACVALAATAVLIAPAAAEASYAERTLAQGSQGRDVKLFQTYLNRAGYRVSADGRFGATTLRATRRFERAASRRVDGRASRADQRLVRSKALGGNGGAKFESTPAPVGQAALSADGRTAIAPADAPQAVKNAIAAANAITRKPYRYGGGHGSFNDSGYDCSGAVSYALHGGGLVSRPLDSTGFASWGSRGRGRWITVYANSGHAYVVIAGLRFDTSGRGEDGPRWRPESRSSSGFVARHPRGL
jgi:cell wall-associated NlpC family hydrolase